MSGKIESTKYLKLLKVFRYIKMYGLNRTFIKVKSSLHMGSNEKFEGEAWTNPNGSDRGDVAIIGCGNFAYSTIAFYVSKYTKGRIKYALDLDTSKSMSLIKAYKGYKAITNFDVILTDPDIKIIFIASNHATHAEYAVKAINAGKNVQIEKPHAVNFEQLGAVREAMQRNPNVKVFLGFNRPRSELFNTLKNACNSESGISSFNWFVAGHEISDDHWYHSEKEGGRIMGNLCHWSDLCIHSEGLENAFPCVITPADLPKSKSNFSVTLSFASGSNATITFSAKRDPFEGVRETLIMHKGDLFAVLKDFNELSMDIGSRKILKKPFHRDHGHKANIMNSYNSAVSDSTGESIKYVYATGLLVLKIKEAIESNNKVTCSLDI